MNEINVQSTYERDNECHKPNFTLSESQANLVKPYLYDKCYCQVVVFKLTSEKFKIEFVSLLRLEYYLSYCFIRRSPII